MEKKKYVMIELHNLILYKRLSSDQAKLIVKKLYPEGPHISKLMSVHELVHIYRTLLPLSRDEIKDKFNLREELNHE